MAYCIAKKQEYNDAYGHVGMQIYIKLQELYIEDHRWFLGEKLHREVSFNEAWMDYVQKGYAAKFRQRFNQRMALFNLLAEMGALEKIIEKKDKKALGTLLN